jgi:predicted ester cyclase
MTGTTVKPHADVGMMTHLSDRQKQRVRTWMSLQDTLNAGQFGDEMDAFFHPDMTYGNPSRPDLGTYQSWKTSPRELYSRFPPSHYRTIDAWAKGDDEVCVYCHHYGRLTGGRYMGMEPQGQEINVEWYSTVNFQEDKIIRIYSIADVLGMMIAVGRIDPAVMPIDPYR